MKTVYALSGGGAGGCFQVGVIKALHEKGYAPAAIYGTSVGALNAAGYAANGPTGLEDIWTAIKSKSDILSFNWTSLLFLSKGWYSTKPLRKLIDKFCTTDKWLCEAVVCMTSLKTGKVSYGYNSEPNFHTAVEASAAIPGIMDPVEDEFVDGGVREQTPLQQVFNDHPDVEKIVVILCNTFDLNPQNQSFKVGNWLSNAQRAIDVMEHEVFVTDVTTCIYKNNQPGYRKVEVEIYCPDIRIIDTLEFDSFKIACGIKQGYEIGKKGPIDLAASGLLK